MFCVRDFAQVSLRSRAAGIVPVDQNVCYGHISIGMLEVDMKEIQIENDDRTPAAVRGLAKFSQYGLTTGSRWQTSPGFHNDRTTIHPTTSMLILFHIVSMALPDAHASTCS